MSIGRQNIRKKLLVLFIQIFLRRRLKPKADIRDVEDLANSIQVKLDIIDIIDSPESVLKATGAPYQFDYRLSLVQYDKRLLRKIGIKFYETSRELHF